MHIDWTCCSKSAWDLGLLVRKTCSMTGSVWRADLPNPVLLVGTGRQPRTIWPRDSATYKQHNWAFNAHIKGNKNHINRSIYRKQKKIKHKHDFPIDKYLPLTTKIFHFMECANDRKRRYIHPIPSEIQFCSLHDASLMLAGRTYQRRTQLVLVIQIQHLYKPVKHPDLSS